MSSKNGQTKSTLPEMPAELADAFNQLERRRSEKEAFTLLSLVNPDGGSIVQLAARDLKGYKNLIREAAEKDMRKFFIQLGKLLEGKRLKRNTWSRLDEDVAFILCFDPKIKSTDAVRLLKDKGFEMSPLAFKQKKYNWRRAAEKTRKILNWKVPNSFLDADDHADDESVTYV